MKDTDWDSLEDALTAESYAAGKEPVRVEKLADDPICLRASIGGRAGKGYYVRYRGDEDEVIACVEAVLDALKKARALGVLGFTRN